MYDVFISCSHEYHAHAQVQWIETHLKRIG